jgi:hypothetical protein
MRSTRAAIVTPPVGTTSQGSVRGPTDAPGATATPRTIPGRWASTLFSSKEELLVRIYSDVFGACSPRSLARRSPGR